MTHHASIKGLRFSILFSMFLAGCCTPRPPSSNPATQEKVPSTVSDLCASTADGADLEKSLSRVTKFWTMCVYRRPVAASDASDYFTLKLNITEGDSRLNSANNVEAWKKLQSNFDKTISTAALTLQMGDSTSIGNAPQAPIFLVRRSSDGKEPAALMAKFGSNLVPYTNLSMPVAQWGFVMRYRLGETNVNTVPGTVLDLGQKLLSLYPVGGAVGAVLKEPSTELKNKANQFVSDLNSVGYAPQDAEFLIDRDDWKKISVIRLVFHDAPVEDKKRKSVAEVSLVPDFRISIYANKLSEDGRPDYQKVAGSGTFATSNSALGGSTKEIFQKVEPELAAKLATSDASFFSEACMRGPAVFSGSSINLASNTDAVFATWLTLINSKSWVSKDVSCPVTVEQFEKLGLTLFPAATTPSEQDPKERKASIGVAINKTIPVKTAVNKAASGKDAGDGSENLPETLFTSSILVRQEVDAIPGIPLKGIYAYTADEFFGKLKAAGATFVGKMYFDGKPSTVVKIALAVGERKFNSELQWESLEPEAKIKAFFITDEIVR